jgi:glutamine amidotransferase
MVGVALRLVPSRSFAMCRLFGFRSQLPTRVHVPLVKASNALGVQSLEHPDGWGIGSFAEGQPTLYRGLSPAHADAAFVSASDAVVSRCVIAHVRKASVGEVSLVNTHPFQHEGLLFAHNGTLESFEDVRRPLEASIAPALSPFVLGETDSERCFFLFLTKLSRLAPFACASLEDAARALSETVRSLRILTAPLHADRPALNFLVTNGLWMAAVRDGRSLHYSTHKQRCSDPDPCPIHPACETPPGDDPRISQLVIASEALSSEQAWTEVPDEGVVGTDESMILRRWSIADFADRA